MEELDTSKGRPSATSHASLAVIAAKLKGAKLFEPIHREVKIAQKTVRYSPTDKLYQAFAGLLAGVCGIVEINERLRADPVLQQAFGLNGCAEQSVIQETLSACTETKKSDAEEKGISTNALGLHGNEREGGRESGGGDLPSPQSRV